MEMCAGLCVVGLLHRCVCVSWLKSRASLRWPVADILVCFNSLANKTTGNHQRKKTPPAGQGGEDEGRRGEDVCTLFQKKRRYEEKMV